MPVPKLEPEKSPNRDSEATSEAECPTNGVGWVKISETKSDQQKLQNEAGKHNCEPQVSRMPNECVMCLPFFLQSQPKIQEGWGFKRQMPCKAAETNAKEKTCQQTRATSMLNAWGACGSGLGVSAAAPLNGSAVQ
jgi:hypothetical protein